MSITLNETIELPDNTKAILWDMDGVLLDTLTLDDQIVNAILKTFAPQHPGVSKAMIRSLFALQPPAFWAELLAIGNIALPKETFDNLINEYDNARATSTPDIHKGVTDLLASAQTNGLQLAVASNNPRSVVEEMLANVGLLEYFNAVVGNDKPGIRSKPEPDLYLEAADAIGIRPQDCVAIEDSTIGAEAAFTAGCLVVGIATGANTHEELIRSPFVSTVFETFQRTGE